VVLVDLNLSDASGLVVVRAVREQCPRAEVMVVSIFGDERSLMDAVRAGATGFPVCSKVSATRRSGRPANQALDRAESG
jgi:DNA-binding NarL/FixJ family response regulator